MKKVKPNQKHTPSAKEKAVKKEKAENIRKINNSSIKLEKYLKKNGLDPDKDWSKDPKHGPAIKKILQEIQTSKGKLEGNDLKPKEGPVNPKKKEKKAANTYEYPEGLDSLQKKRYRAKMRSLLKSNAEIKEASKKALEYALNGGAKEAKGKDKPAPEKKAKAEKKAKTNPAKEKKSKEEKKVKKLKKKVEED